MSNFEHVGVRQTVPKDYATYSLLLVPDEKGLGDLGPEKLVSIFAAFARFGEMIGRDHLAFWFYRTTSDAGDRTWAEISAPVKAGASVQDIAEIGGRTQWRSGYDVLQARLVCARLGLDYGCGPYIAFFDRYPVLPRWKVGLLGERYLPDGEEATAPAFVLRFGGLELRRALHLLDLLEQQILQSDIDPSELRWQQVWARIEQWCQNNSAATVSVMKDVAVRVLTELAKKAILGH